MQSERNFYRQVARATGESITTIQAMGFVPLELEPPEHDPRVLDWDDHNLKQVVSIMPPEKRVPAVA